MITISLLNRFCYDKNLAAEFSTTNVGLHCYKDVYLDIIILNSINRC